MLTRSRVNAHREARWRTCRVNAPPNEEDAKPDPYRDLAADNMKCDDPAKMTYSIPDFSSRGREEITDSTEFPWKSSGNLRCWGWKRFLEI